MLKTRLIEYKQRLNQFKLEATLYVQANRRKVVFVCTAILLLLFGLFVLVLSLKSDSKSSSDESQGGGIARIFLEAGTNNQLDVWLEMEEIAVVDGVQYQIYVQGISPDEFTFAPVTTLEGVNPIHRVDGDQVMVGFISQSPLDPITLTSQDRILIGSLDVQPTSSVTVTVEFDQGSSKIIENGTLTDLLIPPQSAIFEFN